MQISIRFAAWVQFSWQHPLANRSKNGPHIEIAPKEQLLKTFFKESCVMDKLELSLWGFSMNAQGTTAIAAAFVIAVLLVSLRFRK